MLPNFLIFIALAVVQAAATQVEPRKIILTPSRIKGPSRRGEALRKRAAEATNVTVPLLDDFRGTDLQWYGNVSIGTPPQDIPVVWDTGSFTPEFASTLCARCVNQVRFDPNKSSTYVDLKTTSSITFATGGGVDPVVGDNWKLTLRGARETVSIGGFKVSNVSLFLVTNQTEPFDANPYSGIFGLGSDGSGIFGSLISQGLSSVFGTYLTPKAIGNAELTLGGIDTTKFNSTITFSTLPSVGSDWELSSSSISVNGKTTSLLNQSRNIIFDTGTSNVLFSTNIAEAIYALISPNIKPNPDEPGTYGIACDLIPTLPAKIDITFTSQAGRPFNLTIPSSELSVGPFKNNATLCQTLINAFDGLNLVGGSLFKHYYTVWDVGNKRLGFAPI